jgi:type II pantothenate kinase
MEPGAISTRLARERGAAALRRGYDGAAMEVGDGDERIAGVDAGATLTKLALPGLDGPPLLRCLPSERPEAVLDILRACNARRIGITGGGAARLAEALPGAMIVEEFQAWRTGVTELLAGEAGDRFLLVSIGTGTSILLIDGANAQRLGGTPLGGGTVLGLGALLAGSSDFTTLCGLAVRGDRSRVDLSVAEVYADGDAPLHTDVMASSFARLADGPHRSADARPEDLARSIMAMVGENVALLAGSLSLVVGVSRIVFGGSTLPDNPVLAEALSDYVGRFGREPIYLEDGAFTGALGARRLAAAP